MTVEPHCHPNVAADPYHGDVPADCFRHEALGVVFQVRDKRLAVLLWQRATEPFAGTWSLPGGELARDETGVDHVAHPEAGARARLIAGAPVHRDRALLGPN